MVLALTSVETSVSKIGSVCLAIRALALRPTVHPPSTRPVLASQQMIKADRHHRIHPRITSTVLIHGDLELGAAVN